MPEFKSREEYEEWKAKRAAEAKEKIATGDIRKPSVGPVDTSESKGETRMGIKKFSPVIFGIIIICFFLPFMHLSCQGQKVGKSISGFQLITGTTIDMDMPDMSQMMQQQPGGMPGQEPTAKAGQKVEIQPFAIAALAVAVLGLVLSFLRGNKSAIAPAILGVVGLVMILLLKSKLDGDITKEASGMVRVEYEFGFWITAAFFLLAAGLNIFVFLKKEE